MSHKIAGFQKCEDFLDARRGSGNMHHDGQFQVVGGATRAMEMLKLVGLEQFANKLPVLVSTGQQQLAAIARAMACDPPLLVADEPTGNLDTRSANAIIDLFEELSRRGKTVLMVTHDPSLTSRTTRNLTIADGLIVDDSTNSIVNRQS